MIDQLSIFLENKKGRLSAALRCLADNNINLHSLCIAESEDFGLARIICDTPKRASSLLNESGFKSQICPVIAVRVSGEVGSLAQLYETIDKLEVNIEYTYCYNTKSDAAINIMKIISEGIEERFAQEGICVLSPCDVYCE